MVDLSLPVPNKQASTRLRVREEDGVRHAMGSVRAIEGERVPPVAGKRRAAVPGAVTVVFLLALPLAIVFLLFGDRAASSIAAGSLVWQRVEEQYSGNASSAPDAAGSGHDRLLGGLLSPDFDTESCLSRYEASKRWKPSPFPVSPYLVQKLRQYEANHRRCGPGTAHYREAVAQLMSGRNADRAECKYVVWLPIQGLGNRMLSVVSTFLYALLTGRVVLVHEPPEMEGLFCEPFPGTSWLLPPDFPYKDGFWAGSKESYESMLENNIVRYDDDGEASALPPYVYFHLEQINLRLQNHTFCEEDHRVLDRFNWMVLRSDSYFAVALFLMPMYRAELDRMFPVKGSVFHHLGRYLLHPGNRAWGIIERFYDGYLAGADERLGMQVRLVPYMPIPFEVMYEQIIRCTREHDLLPQVTSTSEPGVRLSNGTTKVKAVLVVSLKPEYYDKLHSVYYTNATVTGEVVTVYQPSHDQDQHTEARAHNERALAEIYLLSYCDKLVTTGFSTFGYVAHSLAGLRPWLLMLLDRIKLRADVACVRSASVEPCLHSPPSLVCRAAKDFDPVAHVPFLSHCEDVDFGLKLFD
ncbi:probable fucosyltransferase 7 [Phragmites australis]|uniref:probable fucosyltransferase 7 n=1 Tax=Phragmites australis TaxID=29695 RepID=UPI002D77E814|nr:probable fucosyltransferase 7 [Phragmites australis]